MIHVHKNDIWLNGTSGRASGAVVAKEKYRVFRTRQTGPNSHNHFYRPPPLPPLIAP